MRMTRLGPAAFLLLLGCSTASQEPTTTERNERLEKSVIEERQAGDEYRPKVAGDVNDLTIPAVEILRQLPGIADVELLVSAPRPTARIIHIRDWHFVPRDLYAADLRQALGKRLTEQEIDTRHRELLLEVELVQLEQERHLRWLATHHGLKRLLAEGLTPEGVPNYKEMLAVLKSIDDDLIRLQKENGALKRRSPEVDRQVEEMVRDHRQRLLEYGASGHLAMRGEVEILPLDDTDLLEQAKPVKPDGTVRLDPAKLEARHDGQVKRALASGPCAVLVLGGAHDLSASVRRLDSGTTEYIRVTARRFKQVAGEER